MDINTLLEMHKAGMYKVRCNADGSYTFAHHRTNRVTVNKDEATKVMNHLGWIRTTAGYDKSASHSGGILKKIADSRIKNEELDVSFEHSCVSDTTKNVWRTRIEFKRADQKKFVIIEGIAGLGGKFAVMSSDDNFSASVGFSKLEHALDYIADNGMEKSVLHVFTDDELEELINNETSVSLEVKEAKEILAKRKKEYADYAAYIKESIKTDAVNKALSDSIQEVKDITSGLY